MATHSSILAWRIPGTEEPSGLPSMGSHRVGHDWGNLAAAAAACILQYSSILSMENPMANDAYTGFRVRLSVFNPQPLLIGQIIYLQEASFSSSLNGEKCMGNPMDRRPWQATVHGVTKSRTHTHICILTYSSFLILSLSLISILSLNVFLLSNVILLFI